MSKRPFISCGNEMKIAKIASIGNNYTEETGGCHIFVFPFFGLKGKLIKYLIE